MANKRQKKKQQAKQNIQKLKSVGIKEPKQLKEIKNKSSDVNKLYIKEKRKLTAQQRSKQIKELGYKLKDHATKRYWSEERYQAWYQEEVRKQQRAAEKERKKQEKKTKDANDNYLLIFWRDKTAEGYADTELIERYKYQYKHLNNETLLTYINHYLRTPKAQGAEIGTTSVVVVRGNQRKQYINFMSHISNTSSSMSDINDWIVVYEGKAKRYHDLLLSIHAVIRLLYDASERAGFISDLIERKLPQINMQMARRLAKDIGWRGF